MIVIKKRAKLKSNAEKVTVDPYVMAEKRQCADKQIHINQSKGNVNTYAHTVHTKKVDISNENRKIEGHNQRKEIRGIHRTPSLIKVLTNNLNTNKDISYKMKKNYRK